MSIYTQVLRSTPALPLVVACAIYALPEQAQAQVEEAVIGEGEEQVEEITVTGSKLRRDAFSSISPVQLIDAQQSVRIGLVDTTQMIAESPVVFGTQLDGSVNSGTTTAAVEGVPASGPGAATVALRGLGPERTLMLINGRRLSPSGVRGAPIAPDLNLIPSAMIDRIEVLTDGASSIYGADAVAGVVNIILRENFEGIEARGFGTVPSESGGEETLFSLIGGASNDRSNFTVAAEYFNRDHIFVRDRSNFNDCLRDIEVDPATGQEYSHCADGRPDNAVFIGSRGFVYDTPGTTDIGVPGFSTNAAAGALIGQPNALLGPASVTPYNLQQEELDTQLQGDIERVNLYATGSYNLTPEHSVYLETSYSQRQNTDIFTSEQVFPVIPAQIPQVDADGNVVGLVDNPLSPFDDENALPVYSLEGLSQRRATDIDNFRVVVGVEGDIGFGFFRDNGWIYDAFVSLEESSGTSVQAGMFEPHIRESIDTLRMNADGELECGLPTDPGFGFLTPRECVVIDWFADSLWTTRGGNKRFATQAEQDYLFGNVINTTNIEQQHVSALITGDLFEMPAGTVGLVLGAEYRENAIDSANDIVRAQGLSASEAPDVEGDTVGESSIFDFYMETEIPLHERAALNLSGRYTDEENFGDEFTYSVKADVSPTDFLRLRATYGTTFRAPNLREQFLAGQAGVIPGGNDPCVVPAVAQANDVYLPDQDPRSQTVLDNCVQDGVDPTALGLQANVAIPTETGGSEDIGAETSESWTAGVVFSQPFTDAFDLDLSVTYFNIDIEDTVEELDAITILNRCYNDDPNLQNALCSRVQRRGVNPENNTVALVDSSFVNLGLVTSQGFDINARYTDDFSIGNAFVDMVLTLTGTKYTALEEQIDAESPVDDRVGEAGFPEWAWVFRGDFGFGNWNLAWRSRFIDDFALKPEDVLESTNGTISACNVLGGPVNTGANGPCVRKHFGDSVWYHDLSMTYERDEWSATLGVRNLFDEEPPLIDQGMGPARMNIVVQSTYDLFGQRAFLNLTRRF
jgi:iron complex outermembrane recepter protein